MNQPSTPTGDMNALDARLASKFYSSRRYNPVFLATTGLGFIAIFLLTQFSILGNSAPQLFYIGSITLLFAVAELPLLALAQRNKGIAVTFIGSAIAGVFAILLTLFWQGILPVAILIALTTPLIALRSGIPRTYALMLSLLLVSIFVLLFTLNGISSSWERLQNNNSAAVASIVFLAATGFLLLTITNISQNRKFPSIQRLLLTSFIIIVTIPIVMTAILSAIGAYANSQTQTFSTLQAITTLKQNQIANLISGMQSDAKRLLADSRFSTNTSEALTTTEISPLLQENFKREARLRMVDVLGAEEETYNEIMVLDMQGDVIISVIPENEGSNFEKESFFRQGISEQYVGFADVHAFGTDNLIIAAPIFGKGPTLRGVLVLRSNGAAIKNIMENTPGFVEAETYLVDRNYKPVTKTRESAAQITTKATSDAISSNTVEGKAIYPNYADQQVLGYYEWFQPLGLVIVAEAPLSFVVNNSIRALAGISLLALFVVAIAIAAVTISARTISDPIRTLAQTTESFAAGKLSIRAMVDREDEIGALAKAYNQMATQLQEIIGRLEQRVADRTKDLESQSLRLRVAAEIARDSASARDLNELLIRAADLIRSRFDVYHIGIFLLDNNKEYAVLVASPTEAGRQMIENNHKLRVGEVGIVGRVSATGEPRIALNTGTDIEFFNNPYLPNTRSEMALPLKVENNIIGVLDVQSDQPEAFKKDDVAIMQVMADQLATAIERTRLLQEVERNLRELESAYGQFTRDNWKRLTEGTQTGNMGYRFDNVRLERVTELPQLANTALTSGRIVNSNGKYSETERERRVAIPIKLRGQTIGVVSLKLKEGYDGNTISIVESAAERLASAMESARLYEEARLRADREQSISRVTTAISSSTGYEQILQTTVREIGNILGDTEVSIQIIDESSSGKRAAGQGEP